MSTTLSLNQGLDQSRRSTTITLLLGVASIVLFFAAFFFLPLGDYLGIAAAIASLAYGAITLRRPRQRRSTLVAVPGMALALLTLVEFGFWVTSDGLS